MGCRLSKTVSQPDLAGDSSPTAAAVADGAAVAKAKANGEGNNGVCSPDAQAPGAHSSSHCGTLTRSPVTNGQSVLLRRDTPQGSLFDNVPNKQSFSNDDNATPLCSKPISQIESASQADFFKMLDEKIAHGAGEFPDSDVDD